MHTYQFTFKCERCTKEFTTLITSPDVLERQELSAMEFQLTCPNPDKVDGAGREPARRQKK
jgi:hypothetical protein